MIDELEPLIKAAATNGPAILKDTRALLDRFEKLAERHDAVVARWEKLVEGWESKLAAKERAT